jgi:hypothetical protein
MCKEIRRPWRVGAVLAKLAKGLPSIDCRANMTALAVRAPFLKASFDVGP